MRLARACEACVKVLGLLVVSLVLSTLSLDEGVDNTVYYSAMPLFNFNNKLPLQTYNRPRKTPLTTILALPCRCTIERGDRWAQIRCLPYRPDDLASVALALFAHPIPSHLISSHGSLLFSPHAKGKLLVGDSDSDK